MKNNRKGLSTIVATLLIILLTLVAVGIIWIVVRQVVSGGSEQMSIDAMCIQANVVATRVVNATPSNFSVTLSRQGGEDEIGGVKIVFTNEEGSTNDIHDRSGNIEALQTVTNYYTVNIDPTTGVPNPTRVSVVVYFLDDSGNEQLCQTSSQKQF
jgi:hypothetical protein